ncbi:hypothetical protein JCM8202_005879 [Rhodotorula sphaerocarpa]
MRLPPPPVPAKATTSRMDPPPSPALGTPRPAGPGCAVLQTSSSSTASVAPSGPSAGDRALSAASRTVGGGNDLYYGTAVHASVASASGIRNARRPIEEVRSMAGCAMHSWIAHEDIVRSDSGTRRQQVPSADRQNGSLATSDRVGTVNPYLHESHSETKLATFSGRP